MPTARHLKLKKSFIQKNVFHFISSFFLLVFNFIFLRNLNLDYPGLGHDYRYFNPNLIAGLKHFYTEGLSPFWYTPHYCGGMVMYGNPQDLFYSLPQLLFVFFSLWHSVQISIFIFLILGYIGWFFYAKKVLNMPTEWSGLLALIIISSGFYFLHIAAAHLTFLMFPLIGWLLFLFCKETNSLKSLLLDACCFALLTSIILYGGGYVVLLQSIILFSIILPAQIILHKKPTKKLVELGKKASVFFTGSILINISKIVAVFSFFSNVPRIMPFERIPEWHVALNYIFSSLWAIPQNPSVFEKIPFMIHEKSNFISPIVLFGIVVLPFYVFHKLTDKKSPRLVWTLMFIYFLTCSYGLYELISWQNSSLYLMKELPIFKPVHIPIRFIHVVGILLSVVGVYVLYNTLCNTKFLSKKLVKSLPAIFSIITMLAFILAYPPNIVRGVGFWHSYETDINSLKETKIIHDIAGLGRGYDITKGSSDLDCYEPLFDTFGKTHLTELEIKPILTEKKGYFNIINPACYQFPNENNCKPGDKIRSADIENLKLFSSFQKTTWKISTLQQIANLATVCSLIAFLGFILFQLIHKGLRKAFRMSPNYE